MYRLWWMVGVLMVSLSLMPVGSQAAEHGGQEHAGETTAPSDMTQEQVETTPAAGDVTASAAIPAPEATPVPAPAPATPTPAAPPALKPIVITFSGDLTAVNSGATPAGITVQDRYGVKKEISLPAEAKIAQGASPKSLADLKVGDKVTVEYTYDVTTGKRTAQSIAIGESTPTAG